MNAKQDIVILGAGAIGRGFLPWTFDTDRYRITFVDANNALIEQLNALGRYTTYRTKNGAYESKSIVPFRSFLLSEYTIAQTDDPAMIFMCVGPRNCAAAAASIKGVKCPVVLCENDPETVPVVKEVMGGQNVYFAIPDVITSCTASPAHLQTDPLSIHTEDGVLYVDCRADTISNDIHSCDPEELRKQWIAKLYLHNTPHCIAAYLGSLIGVTYLHEAMQNAEASAYVNGAMNEMLTALKLHWDIPHDFLDWYAGKELQRFSNLILFDPVARVAREPLRKLELDGRLMGAAQMCLALGFVPKNILTGIVSALLFASETDNDKHLAFARRALSPRMLLTYIMRLREGEVLESVLEEWYPKISRELERLAEKRMEVPQ